MIFRVDRLISFLRSTNLPLRNGTMIGTKATRQRHMLLAILKRRTTTSCRSLKLCLVVRVIFSTHRSYHRQC